MISMTVPQYRRRECTIDGRTVRMWPAWTEMLAVLLVSPPDRFVTRETLIEARWPNPDFEPECATTNIGKMISCMRQLGIPIETDWGNGWRIPHHVRGQSTLAAAA